MQVVEQIEHRLLDVNLKGRIRMRVAEQQSVVVEAHVPQRADVRPGHLVKFAFRQVIVKHDADQLVLGSRKW